MTRCATYSGLELRPELQAAYDEMDGHGDYFAYAVCRTWDGQAWEVNTREGNLSFALPGSFADHDEAMAAGMAWHLAELARAPDADELAFRQLWEESHTRKKP